MSRHNTQRDVMVATGRAAAKSVVVEHKGLLPHGQERPGDLTIADWDRQLTGVFDFTVVSPFVATALPRATVDRGHAAQQAEQRKDTKYRLACQQQNMLFVPIVVETCGTWGVLAQGVFETRSTMLSNRSGKSPSQELQ